MISAIDSMEFPVLVTRLENADGEDDGEDVLCQDRYFVIEQLFFLGRFLVEGGVGEGLCVDVERADLDVLEAAWETPREVVAA